MQSKTMTKGTAWKYILLFSLPVGNGVVVAQHYGAKNEQMVRSNASTGILFLMILGVISAVAAFLSTRPACTYLLHVDRSILEDTVVYFKWYSIGLIFQFGYNIFSAIL